MRYDYPLTDETLAVLTDNVADIAAEMDVNVSYLYQILSGSQNDCFAKFQRLYAAAVRAGAPVCRWDNKLAAIRARYEKRAPLKTEIECLAEKISRDADTTAKMVDALNGGRTRINGVATNGARRAG